MIFEIILDHNRPQNMHDSTTAGFLTTIRDRATSPIVIWYLTARAYLLRIKSLGNKIKNNRGAHEGGDISGLTNCVSRLCAESNGCNLALLADATSVFFSASCAIGPRKIQTEYYIVKVKPTIDSPRAFRELYAQTQARVIGWVITCCVRA